MNVSLNKYKGVKGNEKYCVGVNNVVYCKGLDKESATVMAEKLSGEESYIDNTVRLCVINAKTITHPTEEDDEELTLLETSVEQVANQTDLIETARQDNADKCDYIAETVSVILRDIQDLATSIKDIANTIATTKNSSEAKADDTVKEPTEGKKEGE